MPGMYKSTTKMKRKIPPKLKRAKKPTMGRGAISDFENMLIKAAKPRARTGGGGR